MTLPTVSVLLPVFNGDQFIVEAVNSVLTQTFDDFELIVVDDGSTDQTARLLGAMRDPRLRILTQPNAGMAAALNRALGEARGRYVARMDADDRSLPSRFAQQVAYLDRRPDVAVVGTSYRRIAGDGTRLDVVATLVSPPAVARDLYTRNPFGHGTVMARRAVIAELGGYDAAWWPADDYDLWRRLLVRHRGANLPEVLYEYRLHGENSSVAEQDAAADRIRDALWAVEPLPRVTTLQVMREIVEHLRAVSELRPALVQVYIHRQRAFVAEAVRRRRYHVMRGVLPAAMIAAVIAAINHLGQWVVSGRSIARKIARKRSL